MTYVLSDGPIAGEYRLASDEHCVFGIACFVGDIVDGLFTGQVALNVSDPQDAKRWLAGEEPIGQVVRPRHIGGPWI